MEVYTLGSIVPMGGGSSGLVKLLNGWVGRTQAVGMVRPLPACASSAAAAAGAPGTGPTPGTCSPVGTEEPGRSGGACWGGGCCWRRGLVVVSEGMAGEEGGGEEGREGGQMGEGWEKNGDRKREGQETKQPIILNHSVKSEQSI